MKRYLRRSMDNFLENNCVLNILKTLKKSNKILHKRKILQLINHKYPI